MKKWHITDIENITENEAKAMAIDTREIKGHNVYFVDFEDAFGYSYLVFKNNHHIHYANDYELHHKGKTREELNEMYIKNINNKLFTEDEIGTPLKDYEEYRRKSAYLQNYYGMQVEYISVFQIFHNKEEEQEFDEKTREMIYNPIAHAYMNDRDFVAHHVQLWVKLTQAKKETENNYEYLKNEFLYEMYNYEYAINHQGDYDILSNYGEIEWHEYDINAYFEELHFTDLQKEAYLDARKQYYKEAADLYY